MRFVEVTQDKSAICTSLLAALPYWFGLPELNAQYARGADAR